MESTGVSVHFLVVILTWSSFFFLITDMERVSYWSHGSVVQADWRTSCLANAFRAASTAGRCRKTV